MTDTQYNTICDQIITQTMQYIQPHRMKSHKTETPCKSGNNPVYDSIINSQAPITLVYTTSCTDSQSLIADRVKYLVKSGTPCHKTMILNNNIASTTAMKQKINGACITTFGDFCHTLVLANMPGLEMSDMASIANMFDLFGGDNFSAQFSKILRMHNPREKMTVLTSFINQNLTVVMERINCIHRTNYEIDAMLCQNMVYQFEHNPYDIDAIIVNNVHNMPVPALCTVLQYAYRYGCSLFMTGDPKRTIYDFNMAYSGSMNVLSAYTGKNISVIHLNQIPKGTNPSIQYLAEMTPGREIDTSSVITVNVEMARTIPMKEILHKTMAPDTYTGHIIRNILPRHKEKLLIATTAKADLQEIKTVITDKYLPVFKDISMTDLTVKTQEQTTYGEILSQNARMLENKYPDGICVGTMCYELYEMLYQKIQDAEQKGQINKIKQYAHDMHAITDFITAHNTLFPSMDAKTNVMSMIYNVIQAESDSQYAYQKTIESNAAQDLSKSDIILSTIHAASEMQFDHAVILLKHYSNKISEPLCRQALQIARKSECVIFMNYGKFRLPYQEHIAANSKTT